MSAGQHLEKKENRHISTVVSDIFTKFGVLLDIGSPHRPLVSFLDYNKIQDGGRRHFVNGKSQNLDSHLRCLHKFFSKTANIIYKKLYV